MIELTLYIALTAMVIGLLVQAYRFLSAGITLNSEQNGSQGFQFGSFLANTLFQTRLLRAGKIRWTIHFLLFVSFMYLLIVHGLHAVTADLLFDDYQPTLDPFQFLRNLTGLFVLVGCITFLVRRRISLRINQDAKTKVKGLFIVVAVMALIGSGFLLEASKIISEPVFMEMVEEFSSIDDEDDLNDLKAYWKEHYTVYFSPMPETGPEQMENGAILNDEYCLYCHSPIKSAPISRLIAKTIYGAGTWFNENRIDSVVYWLHYGLCLMLLVCLPFSRLFHLVLIPFSTGQRTATAQMLTRDNASVSVASLYACTNCGYCSEVCSVYPNYQVLNNPDILPHSKIETVKAVLKDPCSDQIQRLKNGNHACTLCHKCTDVCPSGIDLQRLWATLDTHLSQRMIQTPAALVDWMSLNQWMKREAEMVSDVAGDTLDEPTAGMSPLADHTESFEQCIQCTVCTNVCPVVDYDSDLNDYTPHQITNLLRLGNKHLAAGSRMVWSCLTCYACQENCPQEIRVTDIILELRNTGAMKAQMLQQSIQSTRRAD